MRRYAYSTKRKRFIIVAAEEKRPMTQRNLYEQKELHRVNEFDGETYEPDKDKKRLTRLLDRVFDLMRDESWRTLQEIQVQTGGSEASVSARLRDLRKEKFGSHNVERQRVSGGTFQYRLIENK
jgi:site-specific DNA-cytosine methylase